MQMKLLVTAAALLVLPSVPSLAQAPRITSIGPEENAGSQGRLSTIAVDALNQPHIACDGGSYVYFYDKVGTAWRSDSLDVRQFRSNQYYNPHLEIDRMGVGWYSGILFGSVGDVSATGIGMITRIAMSTSPGAPNFSRKHVDLSSWDTGMASVDMSLNRCTAYSSGGKWESYVYDAAAEGGSLSVGRGQLYAGRGGEANSIYISKANPVAHADGTTRAVWHVGTVGAPGYDQCMYQNSYRQALGQGPLAWLDPSTYGLGGDGVYCGLTTDNKDPHIAYLSLDASAHAGQGLYANVFDGQQLVRPANNVILININGRSGVRYAPSMCPVLNGGAFICYSVGTQMYIRFIGQDGSLGPEELICTGTLGAICTDSEGNIHLVYNYNGIKYRKITVYDSRTASVPVSAGDFDGDGKADIAVFRPSEGNWYILQSRDGASTRNWGTRSDIPVPADYDGDGRTDLAVFRRQNGTWYISNSEDRSTTTREWGSPDDLLVPGDYDGDGKADLALFRVTNSTWYIRESFDNQTRTQNWGLEGDLPVPADYDGDGIIDIGVFRPSDAHWYIWGSSTGYRDTQWGASTDLPVPDDYDGDNKADIAVWRQSTGRWYILGSTSGNMEFQWGAPSDTPVPGKFDPDNKADVAIFRSSTAEWFIRRSTDNKLKGLPPAFWGLSGDTPLPGDYNKDGKDELAVFRAGAWYIRGVGSWTWGAAGDIPAPSDFDGDGQTDLSVFRPYNGRWYIWGSKKGYIEKAWGAPGDTPVAGDYDGDRTNDIAVFRNSDGFWYISTSGGATLRQSWGAPGDTPVAADYDGDGIMDIGVFRSSTAKWYLLRSSAGFLELTWGAPTDRPVPGDYDKDGKADIAVFRPTSGYWYIWGSKNGYIENQWGLKGDVPLPNDYDGDDQADFAVYRPSAPGAWYVKQSASGETIEGKGPITWGAPGDTPIGNRKRTD